VNLIDTHCHLADESFDVDRAEVIARALESGVTRLVAVGGGGPIEASEKSAELACLHDFMRSTAGIHPHDAGSYNDDIERRIERLLERPEVAAVGETGLDYYYDNSPRALQRDSLARHVALARKHELPIVLHCRSAEADMREVLDATAPDGLRGVVHCFTGDYEDATWYLDKGLLVSFTGIITFKKADDLRDVARRLPLDRLMVETDSPYLAPVPNRGRRNEPSYVRHVAEMIATLHEVDVEAVAAATGANAEALFFTN
jgi:TatD DNase family protein